MQKLIENRHHDAERVLAEYGALGDPRELFVFRYGNGEPVMVVYMQHHMNVGTAIADIDHAIGCNTQTLLKLLDHCDLAVAGGHAPDCTDFPRTGVELELRAVDVFRRYHAGQR